VGGRYICPGGSAGKVEFPTYSPSPWWACGPDQISVVPQLRFGRILRPLLILSRQEDPAPCTPTISCPLARRVRPKGPDLEVRESLRSSHISRDMLSRVFLLLTRIVGLIRAGEPGESRWCAPARTHDVDQGAVDVELLEARAGRGVQVLDAHQVPPRRRGLWNGKVEIRHPRPERPVGAVQGTRVRDLEPIPVSVVMQEVVVGRAREVDLRGAGMVECGLPRRIAPVPGPAAVGRHPEANLGPGEHVGRLGAHGGLEGAPAAGDVGVVWADDWVYLVTLPPWRKSVIGLERLWAFDIATWAVN